MIDFINKDIDLGIIKKSDIPFSKVVEINFEYTNSKPINYRITSVATSCGCTVPEFKKEIGHFQNGTIKLAFNTNGYNGNITKTANVSIQNLNTNTVELIKLSFKLHIDDTK